MGYDSTKNPFSDDYNPGGDGRGTGVSFGDQALAIGAGAASVGADLASGARAASEASGSPNVAAISDFFRSLWKNTEIAATGAMSQDARDRLHSSIFSDEFWEHPFSAGTLKALNMTPGIASAVAPAIMFGPAGAVGSGAVLGAGMSTRDTYDQTEEMSDEEFRQAMPYYDGLRDMGVSEEEARKDANQKLMGLKPLLNAAGNGLAMALGPAGRMAGIIPEGAGASFLKRMLVGSGEGAVGGAVMGGTLEATHQQTEMELSKRNGYDPAAIMAATAEAAAIQGAMGGVAGVLTPGRVPASRRLADGSEQVEVKGPDAAQELALRGDDAPSVKEVAAEAAAPTAPPAPPKAPIDGTTPEKPVIPLAAEENRPLGSPETPVRAPADIPATPEIAPVQEPRVFKTTPGAIAAEGAADISAAEAAGARAARTDIQLPRLPEDAVIEPIEMPVHEIPTELPAEVMAGIDRRLKSIEAATQRLADAGQGPKEGVEAFVAAKRKKLEEEAWHDVAKTSIAEANARVTTRTGKKSREGKGPENRQGKHLSKGELNKRAEDELAAAKIANEHPPSAIEEGDLRRDPEVRAAIMKRADAMVALASERKVRIFQRLRDSKNKAAEVKNWSTILTMARELQRSGGKSFKAFDDFVAAERLLRTGAEEDKALMLSLRRGEGDAASRVAPGEGKGVEDIADSALSPEDLVDAKREITPVERPRISDASERVVAGKDSSEKIKNGLVRVEAKKKPKMRVMEQKQVSSKEESASAIHELAKSKRAKLQADVEGKSVHEVADYLSQRASSPAAREIAGRVKRTLSKLAAAGMKFDFKVANPGDTIPRGLVGSRGLSLLLNEDIPRTQIWIAGTDARNTGMYQETLLHELIHGATQAALHLGRVMGPLKHDIGQLRHDLLQVGNAVVKHLNTKFEDYRNGNLDALTPFEKEIYENRNNALKDEHEILAWGLTNSDMQNLLESVPYKSTSNKGVVGSLFDKFTDTIRRFLGLSAKDETALSEVLRVADRLFEQDATLVVENVPTIFSQTPKSELAARQKSASEPGDFENRANSYNEDIVNLFRPKLGEALRRTGESGKTAAREFVETALNPPKAMAAALESTRGPTRALGRVRDYLTTNDQYANRPEVKQLLPNVRDITDAVQKAGVLANKLKEDGADLTAALLRAQKQNPKLFDMFSKLIHEQTMYGADASSPIGINRNEHLRLSKELQAKVDANPTGDFAHEAAMSTWEGRRAHAQLKTMYDAIVRENPEFKVLQEKIFKFYEDAQKDISTGQIDHILRTYDFKGTDAERAAAVSRIYNDRMTPEFKKELADMIGDGGEAAVELLADTKALKVVNGPYAPLMRRGDHVILGEYKLTGSGKKIDDSTYEFDTRKEAHKFLTSTGLHPDPKIVYYDPETGKQTTKSEGLSTAGSAIEKYQVQVNRQHVEFHEREGDARARLKELEESGLFEKLGLEEKRSIVGEENQFSDRGVERLIRTLEKSKKFQNADKASQDQMRASLREAGLSAMAGNRVQSRRMPRRFVQGASDDLPRNLYDYNTSQANYRAKLKFRPELDDQMKAMWDHVKSNRFDPSNAERSSIANEIESRVRSEDPNEYTGMYTEATRRLATWSYINFMGRASYLILHQTHLPMITAPYLAGRHGLMRTAGVMGKTWKDMAGVYKNGFSDTMNAIADHMAKGTDYSDAIKGMLKGQADQKRVSQMIDHLTELGIIHPQSNIEVGKFLPSKKLGGMAGAFDHGLQRVDTIFRQMTNASEAINRFVGATAAYRLEFAKLTRAGNSEAVAHTKAMEYARMTLTDSQGIYSATNAAPLFKNKWLRPFLQFKQFPQMMYHLIGKLAITSFKGESREVRVQAMASLAGILGMHAMVAGAAQGLPLEAFKVLGFIAKSIGLTDKDWTDVEQTVAREMQEKFGKENANLLLRGLSHEIGVDVHSRLGLNSLVTYGMPTEGGSTNIKEYIVTAAAGAPGSMIENSFKGVHKMLNGDITNGALDAFPMQQLRDIRNATVAKEYASGEKPTTGERAMMAIGFTPARKAQARMAQEAVYNATHEYNQKRSTFIKEWVKADPADRDAIWEKIAKWNEGLPRASKITKADLFKSMSRGRHAEDRKLDNVTVDRHSRPVGQAVAEIYD